MKLSKHFSLAELEHSQTATRLGIDNRAPKAAVKNLTLLCQHILQPIRNNFGAVYISSGYRCAELNKQIGGSRRSQHIRGQAADLVIANITSTEICQWLIDAGIKFDQVIEEGTWSHVSFSENPRGQVLTAHFDLDGSVRYDKGLNGDNT